MRQSVVWPWCQVVPAPLLHCSVVRVYAGGGDGVRLVTLKLGDGGEFQCPCSHLSVLLMPLRYVAYCEHTIEKKTASYAASSL